VLDATPVACARSRQAAHRAELAGRAEYGHCASHARSCRGPRLHPRCTLHRLPVGFAPSGAKADEREVRLALLAADPTLTTGRAGQPVIADRHHYGRQFEATRHGHGITLLRPARAGETPRPGARPFRPPRQVIASITDTGKGQGVLQAARSSSAAASAARNVCR
jgi:hypothetical protein